MANDQFVFIVFEGKREIARVPWRGRRLRIGRQIDAEIRVNEPTMSALHAELVADRRGVLLRDLQSLNGTRLNGTWITEAVLNDSDRIEVGRATIRVSQTSTRTTADEPADFDPAQTLRVPLHDLRKASSSGLSVNDSRYIELLDGMFERLKAQDDRASIFQEMRALLRTAFRPARVFVLEDGEDGEWLDAQMPARPSQTVASEAARTHSLIQSMALPSDHRFSAAESVRIAGIQSALSAPVTCEEQPVAVLYIDRLEGPPFEKRDAYLLGIAANHVSALLENLMRIDALERTEAELRELNRNLDQKVRERTTEIQRQKEEIESLAAAKDELLGIAAHDIRGPMTVIQGTTELLRLQLGGLDESTLERSLDAIHQEARSLTKLLSELLDAKAIETGKIQLDKKPIQVRELLESASPVARLAAENKGIAVVIEAPSSMLVEADPRRLSEALTNLLLNAVKFSESGSQIALLGRLHPNGEHVEIVVADQGVGIPEDELGRLFDSFEQGQVGKQAGGSGLGLMIAKRLVELHGGTLAVNSEVGVGTRFSLLLPAT
ncbi:MAG: ATP-binding protein [Acidobacteriota bacterium]